MFLAFLNRIIVKKIVFFLFLLCDARFCDVVPTSPPVDGFSWDFGPQKRKSAKCITRNQVDFFWEGILKSQDV